MESPGRMNIMKNEVLWKVLEMVYVINFLKNDDVNLLDLDHNIKNIGKSLNNSVISSNSESISGQVPQRENF